MSNNKYKKTVFQHVGKTPIIPISVKILIIFICLLLMSNFATNFINLKLSQRQVINLNNTIMVNQLKDLYSTACNQYQISMYSQNHNDSLNAISESAKKGFSQAHSLALGVTQDGSILFYSCADKKLEWNSFDEEALSNMNNKFSSEESIKEGSLTFSSEKGTYFGVYKYQSDWKCYLIRAELRSDTSNDMYRVMGIITLIIVVLVIAFLYVGIVMFKKIFENVNSITKSLYQMQQKQKLDLIDISNAPNDDITYLAASFNSLSSSINNLLGIFQKFVSKDVVHTAYSEHQIKLEGKQRELTILFSDIKSFTYRTETLGNDIIDLLNVHYNSVIHQIHEKDGVVGSIIGDAILAIYGTDNVGPKKSYMAIQSAWDITNVTANLREKMIERRIQIEKKRPLTEAEDRVYQAVLLDIGVGIDGGNVFYGNIGSNEHMANTVIGDRVNSASRLEGLTRIYKLPVIVSEYIKDETLKETNQYVFYEIDTVQVKGKTEGMKIYYPFDTKQFDSDEQKKCDIYEEALLNYYKGDWRNARAEFKSCGLEVAKVFLERMGLKKAPEEWSGIWTMTTK
ncbi:MAG: adenylate/guanylate cyclase domain-containing protein [Treponema sp.]